MLSSYPDWLDSAYNHYYSSNRKKKKHFKRKSVSNNIHNLKFNLLHTAAERLSPSRAVAFDHETGCQQIFQFNNNIMLFIISYAVPFQLSKTWSSSFLMTYRVFVSKHYVSTMFMDDSDVYFFYYFHCFISCTKMIKLFFKLKTIKYYILFC